MKDNAHQQEGGKARPHDPGRNQRPEQRTSNTDNTIKQKDDSGKIEEQTISFTLVKKSQGILTKRIKRDKQGNVDKDSSGCRMSRGKAFTNTMTPAEFAGRLGKQNSNAAIAHGVCGHDKTIIVSKAKYHQAKKNRKTDSLPIVTRTKDCFSYPDGPGILLLDHDKARDNSFALHDKAIQAYPPEDLITIIGNFFPEILSASWVSTFSTSACIFDSETGEELRGKGAGFHQYLFPQNAGDVPRFLKVLGQRLVLAGYGRIEISRSGSLLERTLVDLLVGSPERLDFVAGAVCAPGLEQRLPEPEYHPGELLDTEELADLNLEEQEKYQQIIGELKETARPTQELVKEEYLEHEAEKLVQQSGKTLDMESAMGTVRTRQNHILSDDDTLYFAHLRGKPTTVADALDNGSEYDKKSCADPLEPEYDGGSLSKACFYWNDGIRPIIHTFAHGNAKYRFSRFAKKVYNYDEMLPELLEQTGMDCGAPFESDALAMLARLKHDDKSRFMRVRNDLKSANRAVILSELDKDIRSSSRKRQRIQSSSPSSSSFSNSYPSLCSALKEKALHLSNVLIHEDENGNQSIAPQSEAAALFSQALTGSYTFSIEALGWYKFADCYWKECPATEFDTAVTYLMYAAAGNLGFSNSYQAGVTSLLQKSGQNHLPEAQPGTIPFQNGILDLGSGQLQEATPENAATWVLPFEYTSDATCPNFLDWLTTAIDGDKETVLLLQAWINALLTGRPDLQVFLHLIGPAGTGKSTFGRLMFILVGNDNATTTTLKQLESNRFEAANIFGKRLAAIEDADKYGGSVSVLKAITGEDPLRLERKNQQQQGSFIYTGQTLLMSNERLATKDYTSGIERRRITIDFKRRVTQEERAKWTERGGESKLLYLEAPGIINWALSLSHEEVTVVFKAMPEKIRRANLDAARFNNPLVDWMVKCLLPCPDSATQIGSKKEHREYGRVYYEHADERLYPNYLTWCQKSGREQVSLQRFSEAVKDAAHTYGAAVTKKRESDGTKLYGVRIRSKNEKSWLDTLEYPEGMKAAVNGKMNDNMLKMQEMNTMNTEASTSYLDGQQVEVEV